MTDPAPYELGKRVAIYRKMLKMSAEELAARAGAGLTRSIIANLENGRKRDVTLQQLMALAYTLTVTPADLVFDLTDPYAPFRIVDNPDDTIEAATWLVRGWFGGERNSLELEAKRNGEAMPREEPLSMRNWSIAYLLKQRDNALYKLEVREERRTAMIRKKKDPPYPQLGDAAKLDEDIRDLRAELYDIDRQLRSVHVNIDRPAIHPGSPF